MPLSAPRSHDRTLARRGGTTTLALDGVAQGSYADAHDYAAADITLGQNGRTCPTAVYGFDGLIDDVQVAVQTAAAVGADGALSPGGGDGSEGKKGAGAPGGLPGGGGKYPGKGAALERRVLSAAENRGVPAGASPCTRTGCWWERRHFSPIGVRRDCTRKNMARGATFVHSILMGAAGLATRWRCTGMTR